MQEIRDLGRVNWNRDEMRNSIPEFLDLYQQKPIGDNEGGMKTPHMFATWFMLRKLKPANVIESGVWKGQGTWLIERTLPDATVYSLDVDLSFRAYISDRVKYFNRDFYEIDWSGIDDKENTLLFFDDHQNAIARIKKGGEMGFKQFIFEDNYPSRQGDCYSLKKAFQHAGFSPETKIRGVKSLINRLITPAASGRIPPNTHDADYLKSVLSVYYEFPPVFKSKKTRWGDDWDENNYPTPPALYDRVEYDYLKIFEEEAKDYTWICYAKRNSGWNLND
jgi:hypothetical protein